MKLFKRKQRKEEADQVSKADFSMFNLKGIFGKFALLFIAFLFLSVNNMPSSINQKESWVGAMDEIRLTPEQEYVVEVKDRIHDQLVEEVRNYIHKHAPTSKLDAEMLVSACEKYNLDITFVVAQAFIESHFGTKGVAARTNSVWNVGTFDNGTILYKYKHPNESIEPYAKLLYEDYLMKYDSTNIHNQKDILQLLQDRGFVNYDGKRYASARDYENTLRKLIVKINMETSINMLQNIRQLSHEQFLTFFGPVDEIEIDASQLVASKQ